MKSVEKNLLKVRRAPVIESELTVPGDKSISHRASAWRSAFKEWDGTGRFRPRAIAGPSCNPSCDRDGGDSGATRRVLTECRTNYAQDLGRVAVWRARAAAHLADHPRRVRLPVGTVETGRVGAARREAGGGCHRALATHV